MASDLEPHVPDGWLRIEKAAWRQLTNALRDALDAALVSCAVAQPRVNFLCDSPDLAREATVGSNYGCHHVNESRAAIPGHATVLVHPPSGSPYALIQSVTEALGLTRAGGSLILITSVVNGPTTPTLSISQVLESLQNASGATLHVDELRSIRWANERLTRGVLIATTALFSEAWGVDDG